MSFGTQRPGSATEEPAPKPEPEAPTGDALCRTCCCDMICAVAIAIRATEEGAISVGRCSYYLPPPGPEDEAGTGGITGNAPSGYADEQSAGAAFGFPQCKERSMK